MNNEIKEILYNLKVHNALADEEDTILLKYITNLQQRIEKAVYFINKNCVNHKVSKEVGFKVYTMMVTDELEKVMRILENGKE